MAQSIKLGSDTYLDASGVYIGNQKTLDTLINGSFCVGTIRFYAGKPGEIKKAGNTAYGAFVLLGFAQGIGPIYLLCSVSNSVVSVYNILTGAAYSNQYISFSYANGILTVTSTLATESYLTFICG